MGLALTSLAELVKGFAPGETGDSHNARCESFLKTLKGEEIYANEYRDLEHLAEGIEEFIEGYYNRCRLHSRLGYLLPEEFERQLETRGGKAASKAATIGALAYSTAQRFTAHSALFFFPVFRAL